MLVPTEHYNLISYLGLTWYSVPKSIKRHFYLSFEDALWDLLIAKNVPKGSVVLVPSFHCVDVMNNIEAHGYKCEIYSVDKNFQISQSKLLESIQNHDAKVVFVLHTQGIKNPLMKKTEWINQIDKDVIVIEDCVHIMVNPEKVEIHSENHFVIDSFRKVSPLPGSFIYGKSETLNYKKTSPWSAFIYQLQALFWYTKFQTELSLAFFFDNNNLYLQAEKSRVIHNDIIGDSQKSGRLLGIYAFIHRFFDFKRINKIKNKQAQIYTERLQIPKENKYCFNIAMTQEDYPNLRGYPIGLWEPYAKEINNILRSKGIHTWLQLEDSQWCKDKKLIFLPMGPHVLDKHIEYVCDILADLIKK